MSEQGTWTWYDLMTIDVAAAIDFYTDVTGWKTNRWEEKGYTMWGVGGTSVGGVERLDEASRNEGVPPHWLGHVGVPDLDASVRRATELGARIVLEPYDLPEVGRFAIIADPQGAVFSLFTPLPSDEPWSKPDHTTPGAFSWHELWTTDIDGALSFYGEMFGWKKLQTIEMGETMAYVVIGTDDAMIGGIGKLQPGMPGPGWLFYVTVADLDAALTRVRAHGGQVLHGPQPVPGGSRIAQCRDPQGVMFALTGE